MILIVDDNPMDRYLLSRQIKQVFENLKYFEFDDGESFLSHLKNLPQTSGISNEAILFLDLNMPICDGFEVLEALSHFKGQQPLKIVVMSSSDHPMDKARVLSHPLVTDYLVKGQFSFDQLRAVLPKAG